MSTVSVPLPEDMIKAIKRLIKMGIAPNMAQAIRLAVQKYLDDQAVEEVLRASKEPSLRGDLDVLAKKL